MVREDLDVGALAEWWAFLEFRDKDIILAQQTANLLGRDVRELCSLVQLLRSRINDLNNPFGGPSWMADGTWGTEYWRETAGLSLPHTTEPSAEVNRKQAVWRGPVHPFDYDQLVQAEFEWEQDEARAAQRDTGEED